MQQADCTLYQKLIADTLMNAPLPFAFAEDDESLAMPATTLAAALRDHEEMPQPGGALLERLIGALPVSRIFKRAPMPEHLPGGTEHRLDRHMAARKESSERADKGHGPTVCR